MGKFVKDWKIIPHPIGILGGSFDPIQLAHVKIAQVAKERLQLGSVVFVPAKKNPLKQNMPIASDKDRVAMLEIGLRDEKDFFISLCEIERRDVEPSYTIQTISEVRQELGHSAGIYFIAGSDVIPELPRWSEVDRLISLLTGFILVPRTESLQHDLDILDGKLTESSLVKLRKNIIKSPVIENASSEVRKLIREEGGTQGLLDELVEEYVLQHSLYKK